MWNLLQSPLPFYQKRNCSPASHLAMGEGINMQSFYRSQHLNHHCDAHTSISAQWNVIRKAMSLLPPAFCGRDTAGFQSYEPHEVVEKFVSCKILYEPKRTKFVYRSMGNAFAKICLPMTRYVFFHATTTICCMCSTIGDLSAGNVQSVVCRSLHRSHDTPIARGGKTQLC